MVEALLASTNPTPHEVQIYRSKIKLKIENLEESIIFLTSELEKIKLLFHCTASAPSATRLSEDGQSGI